MTVKSVPVKTLKLMDGLGCLLAFAVAAFAVAQIEPAQSAPQNPARPLDSERIGILSNGKTWVITDLEKAARSYLTRAETNAVLPTTRVSVLITPQKESMCEFYYVRGFDAPFWKVVFGYDGQVKSHTEGTKKED